LHLHVAGYLEAVASSSKVTFAQFVHIIERGTKGITRQPSHKDIIIVEEVDDFGGRNGGVGRDDTHCFDFRVCCYTSLEEEVSWEVLDCGAVHFFTDAVEEEMLEGPTASR
jgi:hypothetical protein